jgi:hypothetical protein
MSSRRLGVAAALVVLTAAECQLVRGNRKT